MAEDSKTVLRSDGSHREMILAMIEKGINFDLTFPDSKIEIKRGSHKEIILNMIEKGIDFDLTIPYTKIEIRHEKNKAMGFWTELGLSAITGVIIGVIWASFDIKRCNHSRN